MKQNKEQTAQKVKCKHDFGWCLNDVHVFIFEDGKVTFDFQGRDRKSYKIKALCNMPKCGATRNVYLNGEVVKWGKIKHGKR